MKCYVHRDVDAVGVCSECGQGVCDTCAVRIAGKLYCKEDADRVFSPLKRKSEGVSVISTRPMRLTVSSVLFVIYGLTGIGLSIIFLLAGFATGIISPIPSSGLLAIASVGLLLLGGVFLVMGILGVICGAWMWGVKLWGIYIGIPLLMIGLVTSFFFAVAAQVLLAWEITGTIWAVNLILIALLLSSWAWVRSETLGL